MSFVDDTVKQRVKLMNCFSEGPKTRSALHQKALMKMYSNLGLIHCFPYIIPFLRRICGKVFEQNVPKIITIFYHFVRYSEKKNDKIFTLSNRGHRSITQNCRLSVTEF